MFGCVQRTRTRCVTWRSTGLRLRSACISRAAFTQPAMPSMVAARLICQTRAARTPRFIQIHGGRSTSAFRWRLPASFWPTDILQVKAISIALLNAHNRSRLGWLLILLRWTPLKTEFLLIRHKNQLVKIHNASLNTYHSAQNLGFIFDEYLIFSHRITSLSPKPATVTFVNFAVSGIISISQLHVPLLPPFVHSKLGYCDPFCWRPSTSQ